MQEKNISIKKGDISTAARISQQIPEFINPNGEAEYNRRLVNVPHLILIAYCNEKPVGFKVGYERDGFFYSWMGGVLPEFRRLKIAKILADEQESWAKQNGYSSITFKTLNQHKSMLIFALKNGFNIIGFKEKESIETNRILLRKDL